MKAIFVAFDQAHREEVIVALGSAMQRGFTCFPQVQGKGSVSGEPHYGSHAWPSENSAILTICDDEKVDPILKRLRKIDQDKPLLGLRAFVWSVDQVL